MRSKLIKLISCVTFLFLIIRVTVSVTYLFRNVSNNRLSIIGMYEEGPLDVIYIGASSTAMYWQPLKAWNDCGYTSYAYATTAMPGDGSVYYMKEALKTHSPELFVIELRDFTGLSEEILEDGIRSGTDSMDFFSPNRWEYVYHYLKRRNITEETDVFSFYLDIAKYHTNIENLALPGAWSYMDNRAICKNKGWIWVDKYEKVEEPVNFRTEERGEIDDRTYGALTELLEFCKAGDYEVLFVVAPYAVTQEEEAKYNVIGDAVRTYGFDFLNANDYLEKIKLDFSTDFLNDKHVNLFGAEKYTNFLEWYIKDNYDLPDHRGDEEYMSWDDEYARFIQEEEIHKETVANLML